MVDNHSGGPERSEMEKCVENVWREVLGMPDGGSGLTFFELQGQSISAMRITTRIEDELGIVVDVGLLFEDPDLVAFTKMVVTAADATAA